ncbi:MAG TPA: AI-2E family transporter [Ilumatobacteraceae bacterium]|nr:AI-2E family transporter [Ilumatobacteraceae bacterium]
MPPTGPVPGTGRVPLRPILIALGIVAATVAVATVAARLVDIVGLLIFALLLTWLTRPLYDRLARTIKGGPAIAVVTVLTLGVGMGVIGLLYSDLSDGAADLAQRVNEAVSNSNQNALFDRLVRSLRLGAGITDWLTALPDNFLFGSNGQPMVGERLIDLSVAVILAAFFHASANSLTAGFVRLWQRNERSQVWDLLRDIDERAGDYLRRISVLGFVSAALFVALAAAAGVPYPFAVGIWAGFWLIVPKLGWLIGIAPLLVGATTLAEWKLAIVAVIGAAIAVTANTIRKRRIEAIDPRPGLGVVVTALALGVAISGTATAVIMLCLAAIAVAWATSPHRHGLRIPMPLYDATTAWTWGPVVIPRGLTGVALITTTIFTSVVAVAIFARSGLAIVWIALAILFAVAIDRPVDFLQRRLHLSRGVAVGLVLLLIAATVAGLVISVLNEGPTSAARAVQRLPDVVRSLESAPLVGDWLKSKDAADVVAKQLEQLPQRLSRSRGAIEYLPQIGSQMIDLMWVALLTVSLAFDGGRIVRAIERRVPARNRRQMMRLTDVSHAALAGYAAGAVLISGINGIVVLVLALALQTGLAPVLALWAFLWDFVPQVGGFIGGLPLCVFALVSGPSAFVIATVVYLLYQLIETNVIYPAIIGDVIDIPAWAAMLAALAGAAAGGLVGAIVVTPLVGVVKVVIGALRSNEFPGRATSSGTG